MGLNAPRVVPTCVADYVGQDREAARKRLVPKHPGIHRRTTPLRYAAREGDPPSTTPPPLGTGKTQLHGENLSKESDGLYQTTMAKELLHGELASHMHIFTDGSVQENGAVGCAFDLKITRKFKLNVGANIFTAELYAILKACSEVNDMPQA